jgi:hypothetical protein
VPADGSNILAIGEHLHILASPTIELVRNERRQALLNVTGA